MSIYRSTTTKVDEDKVCSFDLCEITSIKQSPVLKGHIFRKTISYEYEPILRGHLS